VGAGTAPAKPLAGAAPAAGLSAPTKPLVGAAPVAAPAGRSGMVAVPAAPIPKAFLDEEEDEPTHVAPFAMRAALAQQTVPSVYEDDDEDEDGDQTKVAPDAILTAAIHASKMKDEPPVESSVPTVRPPPEAADSALDQNAFPTVRPPPGMELPEAEAEAAEAADPAPSTRRSQPIAVDPPVSERKPLIAEEPPPPSMKPVTKAVPPPPDPASAAKNEDVDLSKMVGSVRPPASIKPPAGDLFPTTTAQKAEAAKLAADLASPPALVPAPESESAPAPQGRNRAMVALAIVFLLIAAVIFLTQQTFW
jgi:hypothetical protein